MEIIPFEGRVALAFVERDGDREKERERERERERETETAIDTEGRSSNEHRSPNLAMPRSMSPDAHEIPMPDIRLSGSLPLLGRASTRVSPFVIPRAKEGVPSLGWKAGPFASRIRIEI
jgi:hypothetical protein